MKYSFIKLLFIVTILLLLTNTLVFSQWVQKSNGLYGGRIFRLCVDQNNNNIYAGTVGGIFASYDHGSNWTAINNGLDHMLVESIAINGNNIFAGTLGGGIYVSTNSGLNWTPTNNGQLSLYVYAIAISGNNVFTGGENGVFLSTDNGSNWTAVNQGITDTTQTVGSIALNGGNIFAGTFGGGVFLSTDNGSNWTAVNNGLTNLRVSSFAIKDGDSIFAGTFGGGVFLSTDNGANWTAVNNGLTNKNVLSLTIKESNILAGTQGGGVFISTDNGVNWTAVNNGLVDNEVRSIVVINNDIMAGTGFQGVFMSTNDGINWHEINNGLTAKIIETIVSQENNIYAGDYGNGIYLSTDNGSNWTTVNNGLTNLWVSSLAIKDGGNIFAGTLYGGVFLSTDNGSNWTAVNTNLSEYSINSIIVHENNIFIGTHGSGVWLSTNNGSMWDPVNNGLTNTYINAFAFDGNNLYAGSEAGGVFLSTDNGSNWTAINSGLTNLKINSLLTNGGNVFAGTNGGGVFLSTDNGSNWSEVNNGITDTTLTIFSLAANDNLILAGTWRGGVYISTDNGTNWIENNNGIMNKCIRSFAIKDNRVYAGTNGSGIFISNDFIYPLAPYGLIALTQTDSEVSLQWNVEECNPNKFYLYRSLTSGTGFTLVDSVSAPSTSLTHIVPNPSTQYYFHVRTLNFFGLSDPSNEVSATSFAREPDSQPANLGFPVTGPDSIRVSFTAASGNPAGYIILRRAGEEVVDEPSDGHAYSAGNIIGNSEVAFAGNATEFIDRNLSPNTGYHYAVFAYTGGIDSVNYLTESPLKGHISTLYAEPLNQPSDLVFSGLGPNSYTITFTPPASSPGGYIVIRKAGSSPGFIPTDTTVYIKGQDLGNEQEVVYAGSESLFTDTALIQETEYYYDVFSYNGSGNLINYKNDSPLEGHRLTLSVEPLYPPVNLVFSDIDTSKLKINFNRASDQPTAYLVVRKMNASLSFLPSDGRAYTAGDTSQDGSIVYCGPDTSITDTGLVKGTEYYYKIFALNGSGSTCNYLTSHILGGYVETALPQAPVINGGTVAFAPADVGQRLPNNPVTVYVEITGSYLAVALLCGKSSQSNGYTIPMILSGNRYTATIPDSLVTTEGIWFRIRAANFLDTVFYPATDRMNIPITVTQYAMGSNSAYPQGIQPGDYYLVSLPLEGQVDLSQAFGTQEFNSKNQPVNWAAYKYDQSFVSVNTLSNSEALVVYHVFPSNKSISVPSARTVSFSTIKNYQLRSGWNLVPWPYTFTAGITSRDSTKIGSVWRLLAGNDWEVVNEFKPFGGYAIFNRDTGTVRLGDVMTWSFGSLVEKTQTVLSKISQYPVIRFEAESGRYRDSYNFIGISSHATNDYDASDEIEPLGIGDGVHVYFTSSPDRKLCVDMRSDDSPLQEWEMIVEPAKGQSDVKLLWEMNNISDGTKLILVDMTDNQFLDLSDETIYAYHSSKTHQFKVLIGESGAIDGRLQALQQELPRNFALYPNYPNPFNPTTTIKFDIAKSGNVKLQIYNVLGQLVNTLTNGYFETGKYDIQWNGKDSKGKSVSSGIYIVRLVTDGYVKSGKMLLVR